MKQKKVITLIVMIVAWAAVGSGLLVLLAAANRRQNERACKNIVVRIKESGDKPAVGKEEILRQLGGNSTLLKKPLKEIDLHALEKRLEKKAWIRDAELYFDGRDVLHVRVEERLPIARVFTKAGTSYYIDSTGKRMPLLEKGSLRLPVVTGFPSGNVLSRNDSVLARGVAKLVQYIMADAFWRRQIAGMDISSNHTLELTPVVGNHRIQLGTVADFDEKLDRLFLFYTSVLSKTGMDKYAIVDVQYRNQVLGVKRGSNTGIDSLQWQKNIAEFFEQSRLQATQEHAISDVRTAGFDTDLSASAQTIAPITTNNPSTKPNRQNPSSENTFRPQKTKQRSVSAKNKKRETDKRKPKAVMKRD